MNAWDDLSEEAREVLGDYDELTLAELVVDYRAKVSEISAERDRFAAGVPLICSDERHDAKVRGLEAERDGATARVGELVATLDEVLRSFVHKVHPGRPCLQSQMVGVETVERWRAVLAGNGEARSV